MLYTITEIENYFTPLGYTIEVCNGHLAFTKNGVYVSIQTNDLGGSLEQMKTDVEERFRKGMEYSATQAK